MLYAWGMTTRKPKQDEVTTVNVAKVPMWAIAFLKRRAAAPLARVGSSTTNASVVRWAILECIRRCKADGAKKGGPS